jgi:hypothetical protein
MMWLAVGFIGGFVLGPIFAVLTLYSLRNVYPVLFLPDDW